MTLKLAKTAQFHTLSTCQACSCKLGCHTKVSFGEVSATTSGTGAFIFKAMHCQTGEPSAIISIPNCTVSEATAKAPVGNLLQRAFLHFTNPSGIHPFLVPPPKKKQLSKTIGMPNKSLHRRQPIIQKKSRPQIRHSEKNSLEVASIDGGTFSLGPPAWATIIFCNLTCPRSRKVTRTAALPHRGLLKLKC